MTDKGNPIMRGILLDSLAREAVASVSLSHPGACACVVCRAAQGDEGAMIELRAALDFDGMINGR